MIETQAKGKPILMTTGIIFIIIGIGRVLLVIGGFFVALTAFMAIPSEMRDVLGSQQTTSKSTIVEIIGRIIVVSGIVRSVIYLVAGTLGVKNKNKPKRANACIFMGIIVILVDLLNILVMMIADTFFRIEQAHISWWSVIFTIALAILYLYGGALNHKSAKE